MNKLNRKRMQSRSAELAAPQRREGERSESDRSGGAANSAGPSSAEHLTGSRPRGCRHGQAAPFYRRVQTIDPGPGRSLPGAA